MCTSESFATTQQQYVKDCLYSIHKPLCVCYYRNIELIYR